MGRNGPFFLPGWRGTDRIPEGFRGRDSSEPPRFPLTQVILNPPLARFAKQSPRLPTRPGHHSYVRKGLVGILRPVATAKRLHQANHLSTLLETSFNQRHVNQM